MFPDVLLIGTIECRFCGNSVDLKESKKGKVYYNCKNCGQFFCRNNELDKRLRKQAVDHVDTGGTDEETNILDF